MSKGMTAEEMIAAAGYAVITQVELDAIIIDRNDLRLKVQSAEAQKAEAACVQNEKNTSKS